MKPDFALNLTHDGIGLLHRGTAGWTSLGEVSLEADDLGAELTALRKQAQAKAPHGLTTKLVLPASQILYTTVNAPGPDAPARRRQIAEALEGLTPYPVQDLVFDWSGSGDELQVAVVARETLDEAQGFAESHGFCPVCFVAIPETGRFSGEPWFGLTARAAAYLPEGSRLEREAEPIAVLAAAQDEPEPGTPDVPPEVEPEPLPEITPEPEPTPEPEETPLPELEPEPEPEVPPAPEPEIEPEPELEPEPAPEIEPEQDPEPQVDPEPELPPQAPELPEPAPVELPLRKPSPRSNPLSIPSLRRCPIPPPTRQFWRRTMRPSEDLEPEELLAREFGHEPRRAPSRPAR
ncbi:MAG: hypothetical protein R3D78_10125 [Paracoccaceae bacterium]